MGPVSLQERRETPVIPFLFHRHTQRKGLVKEDMVRRLPSMPQEECSHQKPSPHLSLGLPAALSRQVDWSLFHGIVGEAMIKGWRGSFVYFWGPLWVCVGQSSFIRRTRHDSLLVGAARGSSNAFLIISLELTS